MSFWRVGILVLLGCGGHPGQHDAGFTPPAPDLAEPVDEAESSSDAAPPPAPTLAEVVPPRGPSTGGISLQVKGAHFRSGPGAEVRIDGAPAPGVQWVSEQEIRATLPARPGAWGPVSVTVRNPDGQAATANAFSYYAGTLAFTPGPSLTAGGYPISVDATDFDKDGSLDMVVANNASHDVTVLLGDSKGGFRTLGTYGVGANYPVAVAAADFNGDGRADVATANWDSSASVLLQSGGALGGALVLPVAGHNAESVIVADFNADGHPDLAIPVSSALAVTVLLGRGNGSFAPGFDLPTPSPTYSGCAVNLNGDKRIDLVVNDDGPGTVSVFLGNGNGTFQKRVAAPVGPERTWIMAVADFNQDHVPDLVLSNAIVDRFSLALGTGNGGFQKPSSWPTASDPGPIAAGDFNGDGWVDVVVAAKLGRLLELYLNQGQPAGGFVKTMALASGECTWISVADFNRDGRPDLATAEGFSVRLYLNTSQ